MERFWWLEKNIYRLVNTILLFVPLVYFCGRRLGILSPQKMLLIVGCVFATVFAVFLAAWEKKRMIAWWMLIVSVVSALLLAGRQFLGLFLLSYVKWFFGKNGWEAKWLGGYQIVQICLLTFLLMLLQSLLDRCLIFRLSVAGLMIAALTVFLFKEQSVSYAAVLCCACYIVLALTEWTRKVWKKEKSKSVQRYMLWFVPLIAVYFLLLFAMPVSSKPYEWKYVKATYRFFENQWNNLMQALFYGDYEFDTSLSGFSEESKLSGNVKENKEVVMSLSCKHALKTNVYLVGKAYDTFQPTGWKEGRNFPENDRLIDTEMTRKAISLYHEGYIGNYMITTPLEVCYDNLATDYLFAPSKMFLTVGNLGMEEITGKEGSLYFKDKKKIGARYTSKYYQLNLGSSLFEEFLENGGLNEEEMPESMKIYEAYCHKQYAKAPELSPKLEAYLKEVTDGTEDGLARLRAIEDALSSYEYDLSVGKLPRKVRNETGYLEYFLLESRRGYCTHFATAFILLARAQGYPARYVQGYCVPMMGKKEIEVTSDMAHGWPEVYFDGIGWIPFEPTPSEGEVMYSPWVIKDGNPQTNLGANEDLKQKEQSYYERYAKEKETLLLEQKERKEKAEKLMNLSGKIMIIGVVCLVLLLAGVHVAGIRRMQNMEDGEKYFLLVKRNLRLLRRLGMKQLDSETLFEYQNRILPLLPEGVTVGFLTEYEEVLYSQKVVEKASFALLEEEKAKMWKEIGKKVYKFTR